MMVQPKHFLLHFCSILLLLSLCSFVSAHEEAVFDPHNCSCLPHGKHHHKSPSGQVEYQSQDKYSSGASGSMSSSSSSSGSSSSSTSTPSSSSDHSSSSSSLSQGDQSSSSISSSSQSTDSSTSSSSQESDQSSSSISSNGNQQTSSGSSQSDQQSSSRSTNTNEHSSSGSSQANQETSSGSNQENQHISSGSSQADQQSSSGSSQGNQQTSSGSSQADQQSSSSSSQGNQQTSSGSSQADQQSSSSFGQGNQPTSSGSSQGSQQTSSDSSQNQGSQQTSSGSGQQSSVSISISVNATFKGVFKKVYAFGDSYTDTGNTALMDGLKSFLGGIFSKQSPYASGGSLSGYRLSNGRLVIDYLTDVLGLPALPPYKQTSGGFSSGCNFAVAGATALSSDYFASHRISHTLMWKANPETFLTQIDWFNKFLLGMDCKGKSESECKAELEATLFWIGEIGSSDYARIIGSSIFGRWLTELVVGNTCKILKTLLDRGAKYVVVQGLAPQGCCPIGLLLCPLRDRDNLGCASSANAMIKAHNDLLQKKLLEIRAQYPKCTIVYADTWGAYQVILTSYKQYQFVEPFKACCGAGSGLFNFDLHSLCGSTGTSTCNDPNKYINWDGVHLTEAMHKNIAQLLFHQGHCSPSFDQLIQARTAAT